MAFNAKVTGVTLTLLVLSNSWIDKNNLVHVWSVRIGFLVSQLSIYVLLMYMYMKALRNTQPGLVSINKGKVPNRKASTKEKLSISEYDRGVCLEEFYRMLAGSLFTIFLHWKWGLIPPLVIQAIMQPYNILHSPLARVTVLNHRAWGELSRPWQGAYAMGEQWNSWNDAYENALTPGEVSSSATSTKKTKEDKAAKRKQKNKKG